MYTLAVRTDTIFCILCCVCVFFLLFLIRQIQKPIRFASPQSLEMFEYTVHI